MDFFPVLPRNRLISARLEQVLSNTEKPCILSYYIQFSTDIKIKIIILKPGLKKILYVLKLELNRNSWEVLTVINLNIKLTVGLHRY